MTILYAVQFETDKGARGLYAIITEEAVANATAQQLVGMDAPLGKIVNAWYEPRTVDEGAVRQRDAERRWFEAQLRLARVR